MMKLHKLEEIVWKKEYITSIDLSFLLYVGTLVFLVILAFNGTNHPFRIL